MDSVSVSGLRTEFSHMVEKNSFSYRIFITSSKLCKEHHLLCMFLDLNMYCMFTGRMSLSSVNDGCMISSWEIQMKTEFVCVDCFKLLS